MSLLNEKSFLMCCDLLLSLGDFLFIGDGALHICLLASSGPVHGCLCSKGAAAVVFLLSQRGKTVHWWLRFKSPCHLALAIWQASHWPGDWPVSLGGKERGVGYLYLFSVPFS